MRSIISALALLIMIAPASAHEYVAKDGRRITWYSGNGCCNDKDCRPVDKQVGFTETGDRVVLTDDNIYVAIPKKAERKLSPDGDEHVCAKVIQSADGTWVAHCHFVPTVTRNQSPWQSLAALNRDIKNSTCRK